MSRTTKAYRRSAESYSPSLDSIESNGYPKDARPDKGRWHKDRQRMDARAVEVAAGLMRDLDQQWADAVANETREEARTARLERRVDGRY